MNKNQAEALAMWLAEKVTETAEVSFLRGGCAVATCYDEDGGATRVEARIPFGGKSEDINLMRETAAEHGEGFDMKCLPTEFSPKTGHLLAWELVRLENK
jgi:hypothetical protein